MLGILAHFFHKYWLFVGMFAIACGYITTNHLTIKHLRSELRETREDLRVANETVAAQARAIEELERIEVVEDRIDDVVEEVIEEISELPNAEILVPTDVTAAWRAGIERVRNDESGSSAKPNVDVPAPDAS